MVVIILTAAQKSVREREQGLVSTDIERTVSKATLWQLNLHLGLRLTGLFYLGNLYILHYKFVSTNDQEKMITVPLRKCG